MQLVIGYTDGSAIVKKDKNKVRIPKLCKGGCGVYAKVKPRGAKEYEYELSQGFYNTKVGRMEIMAVIFLLESIPEDQRPYTKVRIFSDSMYVVNSITKGWARTWIHLDLDRANMDLWRVYMEIASTYMHGNIAISWVKGHSGVAGNERADVLAYGAYKGKHHVMDEEC